jgi:hypothetical protein
MAVALVIPPLPEQAKLPLRAHCEMPDETGSPFCTRPASKVIVIHGKRWSYQIAVCEECHRYALDEQKQRWS